MKGRHFIDRKIWFINENSIKRDISNMNEYKVKYPEGDTKSMHDDMLTS